MNKQPFLIISLFLFLLSIGLLIFQLSKAPKEVEAVVGTLNLNAQTANTINTPGGIWNTSGNVGIGTTGPASSLHVYGNGYATFGPNTTWGAYLTIGGNSRPTTNASIAASNGNLHIDAANGAFPIYLNYYGSTGGVNFCNGANSCPASISAAGTITAAGLTLTGSTNICNLVAYTATSGVTYCPVGFYVWSANAATTGQILCCKVSNPI